MNVAAMNTAVDRVFDALLTKLGCSNGSDASLISHWQGNGFRVQVARKSDGCTLTRFVSQSGTVHA